MKLQLVCDVSGSMGEGGKAFIVRTLVLAVAQWSRLNQAALDIHLCAWADRAWRLDQWTAAAEYPQELLDCGGGTSWPALIELLGQQPDGKILLFTDGFWSQDSARLVRRWREALAPDTLRIVKTGPDSHPQLKGPGVFTAEELLDALEDWRDGAGGEDDWA